MSNIRPKKQFTKNLSGVIVFNGRRQLVSDIDKCLVRWIPQRIFCCNRNFTIWLWAFHRWPSSISCYVI